MRIMNRVSGSSDVKLLECVNPRKNKWHLRWDVVIDNDGNASYMEEVLDHKPTLDEIKEIIFSWHNSVIDQKILSGYEWKGMKVWLSAENQFNYKAAYDLAVQMPELLLPVKFKFGTTTAPEYYIFTTIEELSEFYIGSVIYMNTTLNSGWDSKDNNPWPAYEALLQE